MKQDLINKIYRFYRYDCCWPYSLSFALVLVIYWLDFFRFGYPAHWPSFLAYCIIFGYYLYNLYLLKKGRLKIAGDGFFMRFLSRKIFFWGFILLLLIIFKN